MKDKNIQEAIEQGVPFEMGGHTCIAIPFDNSLHDICHWCDLEKECNKVVKELCSEIQYTFIDRMYFAIIE